jgi:hypothetical protein
MRRRFIAGFLIVGLISISPWIASAQLDPPVPGGPKLEVVAVKPLFKDLEGYGFGTATSVGSVRATMPGNGPFAVFGELYLAHATALGESSTTLSNLALGIALGTGGRTTGALTLTLPTLHEWGRNGLATQVGAFTDFEDPGRFDADAWGVGGSLDIPVGSADPQPTAPTAALRLGASFVAPTRSDYRDPEAYAQFGVIGRAPAGAARLSALLSGMAILSQSGLSFGQRSLFALTLSAGLPEVSSAPELFLRLPLDKDLRDVARAFVGVGLAF